MPQILKKYDWYQSDKFIVINVFAKNVKEENIKLSVEPLILSLSIATDGGEDYSLCLNLAHQVVSDQTSLKVTANKLEIKLPKLDKTINWDKLERSGTEETPVLKPYGQDGNESIENLAKEQKAPMYPTSNPSKTNWDKLASEIEKECEEKPEGDQALNSFFQTLYKDASEDTRRAMMKSFYESGGTVLSTNWDEVKKAPVDVKPPDGMEYKKWDS